MKRIVVAMTLLCLTAVNQSPRVLGQAPKTDPNESGPALLAAEPSQPAELAPPAQIATGAFSPAQPRFHAPANDLSNLQEQLQWSEQRARAAEEDARATQRNIPLLILVILFAIPLAFAGGVFFARYKNYQHLNETVRALIEKGMSVPPEILTPIAPKAPPMSDFRKGLLLIWSGIGAAFLLGIVLNGSRAWSLSLIPIFTGLAYLVLWRLERRKANA